MFKAETRYYSTPQTAGNHDFIIPGFGTVEAIKVVYGLGQLSSNPTGFAIGSVGFYDGVNTVCSSYTSSDNANPSSSNREPSVTNIVDANSSTGASYFTLEPVSFITDGVRLNCTNPDSRSMSMSITFFSGLTGAAVFSQLYNVGTNRTNVGFEPDVIFGVSCFQNAINIANDSRVSYGFAARQQSGIDQRSINIYDQHNVSTTNANTGLSKSVFCSRSENGSTTWTAEVQAMDGTGFDVFVAGTSSLIVQGLAIGLDNETESWVGDVDTATSVEVKSYNAPGFEPVYLDLVQSLLLTTATNRADAQISIGCGDGTAQNNIGVTAQNGVSPSTAKSYYDDDSIGKIYNSQGSAQVISADLAGFTSQGFNLSFTQVLPDAYQWFGLCIGGGAAPVASRQNAIFHGINF